MNWQLIAVPPDWTPYIISIANVQYEYGLGIHTDNEFIGLMNLYFDLAWEEQHGAFPGT